MSVILWYVDLYIISVNSELKSDPDMIVLRKILKERPQFIPEGFQTSRVVIKMLVSLQRLLEPYSLDLIRPLMTLRADGVITVDTSVEEAVRCMRACKENLYEHTAYPITIEIPEIDGNVSFQTTGRGGLTAVYPRHLEPISGSIDSRREYLGDRLKKHYGVTSTAAYNWIGPISKLDESESIGVVGTGAGGVQRLLSDIGLPSVGLDLRSTIPLTRLGDFNYRPPECSQSELATLSPLTHTSSGDILDPDVVTAFIGLHNVNTIIVDIEKGADRYGYEVIDSLLSGGFRGKLLIKFFLTKAETEMMYSAIQSVATQGTEVYALKELSDTATCPCIFSFDIAKDKVSRPPEIRHMYCVMNEQPIDDDDVDLPDDRAEIYSRLFADSPFNITDPRSTKAEIEQIVENDGLGDDFYSREATVLTCALLEVLSAILAFNHDEDRIDYLFRMYHSKSFSITLNVSGEVKTIPITSRFFYQSVLKTIPRCFSLFIR